LYFGDSPEKAFSAAKNRIKQTRTKQIIAINDILFFFIFVLLVFPFIPAS
jgi:hypothetical protein